MDRGLARALEADFHKGQPAERKRPGKAEKVWRRLKGQYYDSIPLTLENGTKVRLWGWARDGETAHERILSLLKQNRMMCPEIFHEEHGDGLGPIMLGGGRVVRDFQVYVDGKLPLIAVDGGFCGLNANNIVLSRGMRLEVKEEAPTCGLGNRSVNTKGIRVMEWPALEPSTGNIHYGGITLRPVEAISGVNAEIVFQPLISINPRGLEVGIPGGMGIVPGAALVQDFASNRLREMVRPLGQECNGEKEAVRHYDGIGVRIQGEYSRIKAHATPRQEAAVAVEMEIPHYGRVDAGIPARFEVPVPQFRIEAMKMPLEIPGRPAAVSREGKFRERDNFDAGKMPEAGQGKQQRAGGASADSAVPAERNIPAEAAGGGKFREGVPLGKARQLEVEPGKGGGGKPRRRKENFSFWRIDSRGQMKPVLAPRGVHPVSQHAPKSAGMAAGSGRSINVQGGKRPMPVKIRMAESAHMPEVREGRLAGGIRRKPTKAKKALAGKRDAVPEKKRKNLEKISVGPKVPAAKTKFGKAAPLSSGIEKGWKPAAVSVDGRKKRACSKAVRPEHGKMGEGAGRREGRGPRRRRDIVEYLVVSKPAKKRKSCRWRPVSKR